MRESYLVNESASNISIPLFEKTTVVARGKEVKKVQYVSIAPSEEFVLGVDISFEKRKFYRQFDSIGLKIRTREKVSEETEPAPIVSQSEGNSQTDETNPEGLNTEEPKFKHEELIKLKQKELLDIAQSLGVEATSANSKAEIATMIVEAQSK